MLSGDIAYNGKPCPQLAPDQRSIIIDDWHLAQIRTPVRNQIYDWLAAFAKVSVLMVDDGYRFKELLSKGQATKVLSDEAVSSIVQGSILRLSKVGQANLISNYMDISNESDELMEESDESLKLEKLVSELPGRDWLSVYPFLVLGILQVIETKMQVVRWPGSSGIYSTQLPK